MNFINFAVTPILTVFNSIKSWASSLEPNTIVSIIALVITAITLFTTTRNNKKNNFDNLFFHLMSLLNGILSSDENDSKNVGNTIEHIKKMSVDRLATSKSDAIKKNYDKNIDSVEKGFVLLENMYLEIEKKKLLESDKITKIPADIRIPIRKEKYLNKISKLADIYLYSRPTVYYTHYRDDKPNDSNYPFSSVPDNAVENLLIDVNFKNDPAKAIDDIFNTKKVSEFNNLIKNLKIKFPKQEAEIEQVKVELSSLFIHKNMELPSEITEEQKKEIIKSAFSGNKHGVYFRTVHRILKIIIDFSHSKTTQKKYTGIFRTQLSENHLMILFYNAQYTDRGKKFKQLVTKLNLWGDEKEVDVNADAIHFATSNLIWKDTDLKILKNEYVRK